MNTINTGTREIEEVWFRDVKAGEPFLLNERLGIKGTNGRGVFLDNGESMSGAWDLAVNRVLVSSVQYKPIYVGNVVHDQPVIIDRKVQRDW